MFGFEECSATFHLCSLTDCATVGFKTISHTDGMPRAVISPFPLPLCVCVVVLWSRRGAVCLWQPCRVRSNGSAAAGVRLVLLRCSGVPQTLPWKTAFLHPLLHDVHSLVSSDRIILHAEFNMHTISEATHYFSVLCLIYSKYIIIKGSEGNINGYKSTILPHLTFHVMFPLVLKAHLFPFLIYKYLYYALSNLTI